jgi:hypothetical protein
MNRNVLHAALAVLGLSSSALAQQPTLSATVTEDLEVVAQGTCTFCIDWSFLPVGPLPAGGVTLSASTLFGSSAQMGAAELTGLATGVTGFRWTTSGQSSGSFEGAYAGAYGAIELQLALPAPESVLVVVEGSASTSGGSLFGTPSASTAVDIDGDQVNDWTLTGGSATTEFGLRAGPAGVPIALSHGIYAADGSASNDVQLTFYPGHSPIASYGPGCTPLTWSRGPTGAATLSCPAANGSVVLFVHGTSELQVPLSFAPGCFLLTNVRGTRAVQASGGSATLALPDIALPTGRELRMQAIVFDRGTVRTTNGLVMTGS